MKKSFLILAMTATVMMTACTTDGADECLTAEVTPPADPQQVTLAFTIFEQEPMTRGATTRTATGVADYCTRLDVWIMSEGETVSEAHQASGDAGFGTVQATLDRRRTYTLYAVGHRSAEATTLEDGIVRWKDEKVTHTFFFAQTFTPAEITALDCTMRRIVGNFQLNIADQIPAAVKTLRFEIPQTATRYDVTTQTNTNLTDRTTDISYGGTSATFNLYLLAQDDAVTPFDITVTALDQDGQAIQQRTFSAVPIQNNHRTIYRGAFFTDEPMTAVFSADDWQVFDTVEF